MAPSHRFVFAILISLNFGTFVFTYKERYTIYFREARNKVPVTVEMDLSENVAFLSTVNAESRRNETVSLYDYSTNMIAFKDSGKNSCYLEKMNDASFIYDRRLLKSLSNQVLLEQAHVLYVKEPPLSRREVSNLAGMKILHFCGRTLKYLISDSPAEKKRRSKRSTRPRASRVQKTYSHHEHRSENYARFGHETSYNQPPGSSTVTFIDPVVWPFNNSQPSAFQLAAIRHLKRNSRDRNLRTFDKPVSANSFYGSSVGNSGQINTKIQSDYPGHSGFEANGQFALTHAGSFGRGSGSGHNGRVNGNAGTYSDSGSRSIGQHHTSQTYLPVLPNQNNGQQYIRTSGSQEIPFRPGGGNGHYNPNILHQQNPNIYTQRAVDSGLSSQSRVELEKDKFHTGASSQSAYGADNSQAQVQGSASRNGAFQAQAQSSSLFGSSRSLTQGSEAGAQSSSLSELQNIGQSQTHTQLAYNKSIAEATALTSSQTGSISSQSHGGEQGGQASSHAKGPGETSSSARIRFNEEEKLRLNPFLGKAEASAQGGVNDGQSRTQITSDHKGSIYSAVASGSYGQPDEHHGPVALAFPGNSQLSYLSQTPPRNPSSAQMQTRDNSQPSRSITHYPQTFPENRQQQYHLPSNIKLPVHRPPSQGRYGSVPPSTHQMPANYRTELQKPANVPINSQYVPQDVYRPQKPPPGAKDKRLILQPFVNKQPLKTYFIHDQSSSFQQQYLPSRDVRKIPTQTHLLTNGGYPKTGSQQVTPQSVSVPAATGFRTRVVTTHVQDIKGFFPTPALDVATYKHQLFHRQQHGHQPNKQVQQNPRIQLNQNMFIKTFPSHQLPPANPTVRPHFHFPGIKSDQPSKCSSSCFHGYKIAKTVKICRVVAGCQN